jgi:hypothetical protein
VALFVLAAADAFANAAARGGTLAALGDSTYILGYATTAALYVLVAYLAIEPYARRRWPGLLIAWARLVAGRVRDPLVARHILIGIIGGLVHALLSLTSRPIAAALDGRPEDPSPFKLGNVWDSVGTIAAAATEGIRNAVLMIVGLVIFTVLLRKRALAGTAVLALWVTFFSLSVAQRPSSIPSYVAIALLLTFLSLRYGPIALAVTQGTFFAFLSAPLIPGAGWATAVAPVTLVAITALALWAFRTSLGNQPMFSASLLDE